MTPERRAEQPHRRLNPLNGRWVLVSPHRMLRPWQGQVEPANHELPPPHDPDCYLCPGNRRASGDINPDYRHTFVFENDFPALLPDTRSEGTSATGGGAQGAGRRATDRRLAVTAAEVGGTDEITDRHGMPQSGLAGGDGLLRSAAVRGECRVVCFSPRHDLTLARMSAGERLQVVRLWLEQTDELSRRWRWVQVFENRGEMMGASNPHPHGQIWALDAVPGEVTTEDRYQREYFDRSGTPLLLDYAMRELELGERTVAANDRWLAVVPYWAVWPFETILLPLFPASRLTDLGDDDQVALADILGRLLVRYDNLFEAPFPYTMGWHGAPPPLAGDDQEQPHWQLHAHFYPPLLRSASVRKFMVGFEMLGEPQRDLTPEQAAARLKGTSERHYLQAP